MATIVNTPSRESSDSSAAGVVVGILIALLLIVLFFVYGLPYLRGTTETGTGTDVSGTINLELPTNAPAATTNP
jgi:hypothetical protein